MLDIERGNDRTNLHSDHQQEPGLTSHIVPNGRLSIGNLQRITADQVRTWSENEKKRYKSQLIDLSKNIFTNFYRLSKRSELFTEVVFQKIIGKYEIIRINAKAIDEGANLGGTFFGDFKEKLAYGVDVKSSISCMSATIRYHNNDIFKLLMKDMTGIEPSTTGIGVNDYRDFEFDVKHYKWFFRALIDAIQVRNELGMIVKSFQSEICKKLSTFLLFTCQL